MDSQRREHLEAQLSAYLDDELTATERAEVEAFLVEDAEARQLLAELEATVSAIRSLPRARASDDLMESIRARMEKQALLGEPEGRESDTGGGSWNARPWAAAAIIALAATAGYVMWPGSDDDRVSSERGGRTLVLEDQLHKQVESPSTNEDSFARLGGLKTRDAGRASEATRDYGYQAEKKPIAPMDQDVVGNLDSSQYVGDADKMHLTLQERWSESDDAPPDMFLTRKMETPLGVESPKDVTELTLTEESMPLASIVDGEMADATVPGESESVIGSPMEGAAVDGASFGMDTAYDLYVDADAREEILAHLQTSDTVVVELAFHDPAERDEAIKRLEEARMSREGTPQRKRLAIPEKPRMSGIEDRTSAWVWMADAGDREDTAPTVEREPGSRQLMPDSSAAATMTGRSDDEKRARDEIRSTTTSDQVESVIPAPEVAAVSRGATQLQPRRFSGTASARIRGYDTSGRAYPLAEIEGLVAKLDASYMSVRGVSRPDHPIDGAHEGDRAERDGKETDDLAMGTNFGRSSADFLQGQSLGGFGGGSASGSAPMPGKRSAPRDDAVEDPEMQALPHSLSAEKTGGRPGQERLKAAPATAAPVVEDRQTEVQPLGGARAGTPVDAPAPIEPHISLVERETAVDEVERGRAGVADRATDSSEREPEAAANQAVRIAPPTTDSQPAWEVHLLPSTQPAGVPTDGPAEPRPRYRLELYFPVDSSATTAPAEEPAIQEAPANPRSNHPASRPE